MNGSGVNHPPSGLTVPVAGQPTMATSTTVMLPVQHKQWVVYVINPQQVASHMVHALPGYAPVVPLHAQQATVLPQHGVYRPIMSQWQPQATTDSRPPVRTAPSSEPVQDEHYNYLRHTHHDRLNALRTQDWQYVAHILKPGMEQCGLSLPNEKAVMDILLQLREAQNIDSFEQLEAALMEWLSNQETQAPQHDVYRPAMPQWQPQETTVSRPAERAAPSSEPVQDEHYNYLRHTHHDRLDSMSTQDWQYVAHILKPEMEQHGLSLPNEKAAMDILLQLRETQHIGSFEQLEAALLEWISNEETQVKQPLNHVMPSEGLFAETSSLGTEDDTRSLHDSAISESEDTESLFEDPEVRDREVTSDYDTLSDVSRQDDHDSLPGDLPADVPGLDQLEPAKTAKRKRYSPKAIFERLTKPFRKGKVASEPEKMTVSPPLVSEQNLRRDVFAEVPLPPACEHLEGLGEDVEVHWDYLKIAADEHKAFIGLLHEQNMENADSQAWRDRVFKRTGLASMEAIQERKQEVITGLRKAVSDLEVMLEEYRRQEAIVALESGNYDENSQEALSTMQKRINGIALSLEKVQKAIKKMR